eukprot:jgi/Mesvir1/2071/Mv02324-RA.1
MASSLALAASVPMSFSGTAAVATAGSAIVSKTSKSSFVPSTARVAGLSSKAFNPLSLPKTLARPTRLEARADAYICVECGYIYDGRKAPFSELPKDYKCPVCQAPKRRFKKYTKPAGGNSQKEMAARMETMEDTPTSPLLLVGAAVAAAALFALYTSLNASY